MSSGDARDESTSALPSIAPVAPPPLVSPRGLTESSDCQALLLVPEAKLKWTASPTTGVTGQVILRSSAKTGAHSNVGGVTGCTTISSPDTTVTGLGSTFWFKVEAVAG